MATLGKSLVIGLAIGVGWLVGTVLLGGASVEAALTGNGVSVAGAVVAFAVATIVAFVFR